MIVLWDPTDPKYTNRSRRSGKTLAIGKLSTYLITVLFLSIGSVYFLNTCKASQRFTPNLPVISLYFDCLLVLVASATTTASFT